MERVIGIVIVSDVHGNILIFIIINHKFGPYSHGLTFLLNPKILIYVYI